MTHFRSSPESNARFERFASLQRFDAARMFKFLRDWREEPAQDLASSIAEQLPALDELESAPSDRALIILKNLR